MAPGEAQADSPSCSPFRTQASPAVEGPSPDRRERHIVGIRGEILSIECPTYDVCVCVCVCHLFILPAENQLLLSFLGLHLLQLVLKEKLNKCIKKLFICVVIIAQALTVQSSYILYNVIYLGRVTMFFKIIFY